MTKNRMVPLVVIGHFIALLFTGYMSGCSTQEQSMSSSPRTRIKDEFAQGSTPYYRNSYTRRYHRSNTSIASRRIPDSTTETRIASAEKQTGTAHIVRSGETLYSISRAYGVSPRDIVALNRLGDGSIIKEGQRLEIPGQTTDDSMFAKREKPSSPAPVTTVAQTPAQTNTFKPLPVSAVEQRSTYAVHTVKRGETIWQIAEKFDVSVNSICAANKITRDTELTPGEKIKIPVN